MGKRRAVLFSIIIVVAGGVLAGSVILQKYVKNIEYSDSSSSDLYQGDRDAAAMEGAPWQANRKETDGLQPAGAPKTAPKPDRRKYTACIKELKEYIAGRQGMYGIYFMSLTTGYKFGINENEEFVAASTTKVPINLYLFKRIAEKKIKPSGLLEYTADCYEEGTGSLQYEELGTKYTVRELSRRSIEESDNIAVNILSKSLGADQIRKFMEGIVKHPVDFENNISTPKDMAAYMKAVLDFGKKHGAEGDELLEYLENTEFNDRLPFYLPQDVPVAHKIGNQVRALHDVGIVFAEKPYIIAVMTREVDEDEAPEVIARISKMVYACEQK